MRDHEQEIQELGANVAAVGVGGAFYAKAFREDAKIDFPLLVDEKLEAYKALGLRRGRPIEALSLTNSVARVKAFAAGHRYGKIGQDPMQLGGAFVFAPGDRDLFTHLSTTFGDNAPAVDLVGALRAAQRTG